jgi:hypothetical protein
VQTDVSKTLRRSRCALFALALLLAAVCLWHILDPQKFDFAPFRSKLRNNAPLRMTRKGDSAYRLMRTLRTFHTKKPKIFAKPLAFANTM